VWIIDPFMQAQKCKICGARHHRYQPHIWPKGEPAHARGRPDDRERSVKLFAEVQKIYRECSPAAAREMCRLA
jgi:hypothetical protein